MPEEIERRVTNKMSLELFRAESHIPVALSKLDGFLLKPQVRMNSGSFPQLSRNSNGENKRLNGDRFQIDPRSEVGTSLKRPLKIQKKSRKRYRTDVINLSKQTFFKLEKTVSVHNVF